MWRRNAARGDRQSRRGAAAPINAAGAAPSPAAVVGERMALKLGLLRAHQGVDRQGHARRGVGAPQRRCHALPQRDACHARGQGRACPQRRLLQVLGQTSGEASNGNPRLPDSLHYIDPSDRPNVYQKVSN